jgi:hypothetical protein
MFRLKRFLVIAFSGPAKFSVIAFSVISSSVTPYRRRKQEKQVKARQSRLWWDTC